MERAQMAFPLAEARANGSSPTGLRPSEPLALTRSGQAPATPPAATVTEAATWIRRTTTVAVVLVAVVAALASYEHMRALAELAGEGWRSRLLPISVDGLAVAASMTMLVRRRAGERAGVLPWVALLLGLGASLAANVAAADPTVVGRLVAAWPPVGLLLSYELLMQQSTARGGPGVQTVRPVAVQSLDGGNPR